jgi:ketosteroid isomerase-like protein
MSEENVEIVRRVTEGFIAGVERGDFVNAPENVEFLADGYEWILETGPVNAERQVWRGREGFLEFIRDWTEDFPDWSARVERLIDAGDDRVVALTSQSATGKGSGVPVELNLGMVFELEDGRIVRIRNYQSHAEALEAAGLSE